MFHTTNKKAFTIAKAFLFVGFNDLFMQLNFFA
jgi:hypothetical protein